MSEETETAPVPQKKASARSRGRGKTSKTRNFLEVSPLISVLLVATFGIALIVVCFLGAPQLGPHSYAHQKSPQRILSSLQFEYISDLRTRNLRDQRALQIHPVYTIKMAPFEKFQKAWVQLNSMLEELAAENAEGEVLTPADIRPFVDEINETYQYKILAADVDAYWQLTTPEIRTSITENLLPELRAIFAAGIFSPSEDFFSGIDSFSGISLIREDDAPVRRQMEPLTKVTGDLFIKISGQFDFDLATPLDNIWREALVPNIQFNQALTQARTQEARDRVRPVMERVNPGDVIVDSTGTLSALELERLAAYRNELRSSHTDIGWFNPQFREQVAFSLLLFGIGYLFLHATQNPVLRNNRKVASTAFLILAQLGLVRGLIQLADIGVISTHPLAAQLLPYLVPYAVAPILIGVLLGVGPALFVSAFLSLMIALMFNGSLLMLIIAMTASVTGLYFCRSIRKRSKLVKSGLMSGVAVALCPIILSFVGEADLSTVGIQVGLAFLLGFFSGVLLVGLLPLVESSFRFTTDITLLELTDYNHPLLRELQLRAPGSYHHSLMLANLTENAAAATGANPLLARVCSYFHDVGKMVKPEYFIENQADGINPHMERNPSMSALVIKAHVKEGVALARQHRLPQVIIDVIQQHHGTSLIQYFFSLAQNQEREKTRDPFGFNRHNEQIKISESTYRYDGPKPRFKESAIIFLGDAVEAASRTLRKVSPQSIEELIDKLFDSRIQDGQLDESPLTFQDIRKIKKAFTFTLINALHARIDYPAEKKKEEQHEKPEKPAPKKEAANG